MLEQIIEERERIFYERYPNENFFEYKKIIGKEAQNYSKKLFANFGLEVSGRNIDHINDIISKGEYIKVVDEEKFNFDELLGHTLKNIAENAFLNFGDMREFYELSFENLSKYFDDLYFPGADDIEIFDNSCAWLVSINHDNGLILCMPSERIS